MASPTLVAKLAITFSDPKLWEKVVVICIAVFCSLQHCSAAAAQ